MEGQEGFWAQFGGAALQKENIQQLAAGAQETCKQPQASASIFPTFHKKVILATKFSVTIE